MRKILVIVFVLTLCHRLCVYGQAGVPGRFPAHLRQKTAAPRQHVGQLEHAADSTKEQLTADYSRLKEGVADRYKTKLNAMRQFFTFAKDSAAVAFRLPALIRFSDGQASISHQFGSRTGNFPSELPIAYTRFQLNGGVTVLGFPLRLNTLLTTEQSSRRQPMNQVGIDFDTKRIRSSLQERLQARMEELEQQAAPRELADITRLHGFYRRNGLQFNDTRQLSAYIKQAANADSLAQLPKAFARHAQDSLQGMYRGQLRQYRALLLHKRDSLQRLADARRAQAGQRLGDLVDEKVKWRVRGKRPAAADTTAVARRTKALTEAIERALKDAGPRQGPGARTRRKGNLPGRPGESLVRQWESRLPMEREEQVEKLRAAMRKDKISPAQLRRWQAYEDSLRQVNPLRLAQLAELRELKGVSGLDLHEGIAVLRKYNLLPRQASSLLGALQHMGVGTQYPTFSRYTLRGVAVKGVHLALQPGPFYAAYAGTRSLVPVPEQRVFGRQLRAGQLGVGAPEGNHLYVTALYGRDNPQSFRGDTLVLGLADTTFYGKPRQNYVVGAQFGLVPHRRISLEGEWAQSVTAMNVAEESISWREAARMMGRPGAGGDTTATRRQGVACALEARVQVFKNTGLKVRGEQVSPQFYSLGAPYQRNNLVGYELKLEQKLVKGKVQVTPQYGYWKNSGPDSLPARHTLQTLGGKARITLRGLPQVHLVHLRSTLAGERVNSTNGLSQLIVTHPYTLGAMSSQSSVTLTDQRSQYQSAETSRRAEIRQITLQQQVQFPFRVSAAVNGTMQQVEGTPGQGRWVMWGGNVTHKATGAWEYSLGAQVGANQREGKRQSAFAESGTLLWNKAQLTLRLERNLYEVGDAALDYREWFANVSVSCRF